MTMLYLLVVFALRYILPTECSDPHVVIPQGEVIGTTTKLNNGVNIDVFRGIPYAQPPVGEYISSD